MTGEKNDSNKNFVEICRSLRMNNSSEQVSEKSLDLCLISNRVQSNYVEYSDWIFHQTSFFHPTTRELIYLKNSLELLWALKVNLVTSTIFYTRHCKWFRLIRIVSEYSTDLEEISHCWRPIENHATNEVLERNFVELSR